MNNPQIYRDITQVLEFFTKKGWSENMPKVWRFTLYPVVIDYILTMLSASDVADIEKHVQRLNSYFGFMIHRLTYGIRWRIWKEIPEDIRKSIYCVSMKKLRLRPQTRHSCNTRKKAVWWQNGRVITK